MPKEAEGMRERKKRQTRESIAAAAGTLFAERGYDAVTMLDVAAAADVAEKTVYNHFPTKEHLVLGPDSARQEAFEAALRARPAGVSVIDVIGEHLVQMVRHVTMFRPENPRGTMPYLVATHPAVRAWFLSAGQPITDVIARHLADEVDTSPDDVRCRIVARWINTVEHVAIEDLGRGFALGEDTRVILDRIEPAMVRAFQDLRIMWARQPEA